MWLSWCAASAGSSARAGAGVRHRRSRRLPMAARLRGAPRDPPASMRPSASTRARSHSSRPSHSPSPSRITGKWRIVAVWISVSASKSSSSVPYPPGAMHEGAGVADEHHLAGEEVAEAKPDVQIGVQRLLPRELDVAADRQRADVACATVRRLHQPRTAAGDDRVTGAAQARADLADQRVVGVLARRARRSEHRHGAPDVGQRVKPRANSPAMSRMRSASAARTPGRLVAEPQQQLLVKGQLALRCLRSRVPRAKRRCLLYDRRGDGDRRASLA